MQTLAVDLVHSKKDVHICEKHFKNLPFSLFTLHTETKA